jgi:hypothetical protein
VLAGATSLAHGVKTFADRGLGLGHPLGGDAQPTRQVSPVRGESLREETPCLLGGIGTDDEGRRTEVRDPNRRLRGTRLATGRGGGGRTDLHDATPLPCSTVYQQKKQ